MQKINALILTGVAVMVPTTASAVTLGNTINTFSGIINGIIPIILALAVLYFFWGLANYILKSDDSEGRSKAINTMFMGIIAIFVMVSIWGIIRILQETFEVTGSSPIIPKEIRR
ncbi:hypothetical protein COB52_02225 [Candidatus Kaiserbacteria bacterium]|nr:MAG: hypothetical protein COB52_02225 [Candidatus Kaiserbacteria bacterium]